MRGRTLTDPECKYPTFRLCEVRLVESNYTFYAIPKMSAIFTQNESANGNIFSKLLVLLNS